MADPRLDEGNPAIAETIDVMKPVIGNKPKLAPQHLARPPFKLLHPIIISVASNTGYLATILSEADKDLEAVVSFLLSYF